MSSANASGSIGSALITGASSGIGAVYADRLAERGYDLILVARDTSRLSAVAERIRAKSGRSVQLLAADLTVRADQLKVEERLRSDKSISMIVNNAGVGSAAKLLESDVETMDKMIQLNVTALMRLAYAAAPEFAKRGKGAIINIASIVALAPDVLNGVYSGTKSFVLTFSQSLHHELSAQGVQIQAVLPGATSTDFWNVAGLPVAHLPTEIVMNVEEMVDASLVGFDRKELVTIPSLPDAKDWIAFDEARRAMAPNLSLSHAAARYKQ